MSAKFVDMDPQTSIQLTAAAWATLDNFAPQSIIHLLQSTCRDGLWDSLHNAVSAGCVHGEFAKARLEAVVAHSLDTTDSHPVLQRWLDELCHGPMLANGERAPVLYLSHLLEKALGMAVVSERPFAAATARMLLDAGAPVTETLIRTANGNHATEIVAALTGSKQALDKINDFQAQDLLIDACRKSVGWGTDSPSQCAKELFELLQTTRTQVIDRTTTAIFDVNPDVTDVNLGSASLAAAYLALFSDGAGYRPPEWRIRVSALIDSGVPYQLNRNALSRNIYAGALRVLVKDGGWNMNTPDPKGGDTIMQKAAKEGSLDLVNAILDVAQEEAYRLDLAVESAKHVAEAAGNAEIAQVLGAYQARQAVAAVIGRGRRQVDARPS